MSHSSSRSSWQDDMGNLRLAKNQLLKSMKQFFQMTDKLIEDQREIGNLTTIDCKEPTWSATSFLCDTAFESLNAQNLRLRRCGTLSKLGSTRLNGLRKIII